MSDAPPNARKPRLSYLLATVFGVGYLHPGPGTWGSLIGVGVSILSAYLGSRWRNAALHADFARGFWSVGFLPSYAGDLAMLLVSAVGVLVADRVARHSGVKDPQFVVIDEVSGQLIALSLPFVVLNWKSWLLGFILFRIFDIWKPFPARQAESLPGGWGIMADDWIAGIYAALVLALAQRLGL
jgi:phosphatidylglycerophosphatase A